MTDAAGRVTFLNAVGESLTEWTTAEAKGEPLGKVFNIVNETSRQPVDNPAVRALQEGVVVGLANHTVLISKNASERGIDDSAAPIRNAEGNVVGCVLVFRDITDRRKDEFLATLAHELRNPLAPIRNSLEVMKRVDGNAELTAQALALMERQMGQMVRLVDDLLDISRITRNMLHLRKERIELASVIHHAACNEQV